MGKIYTIEEISAIVKPIAEQYGIEKVWLFGSYARGEATEESDVDLLVDRTKVMTMFELGGFLEDTKEHLNKSVDVVTVCALYNPANTPLNACFRGEVEKDRREIYG